MIISYATITRNRGAKRILRLFRLAPLLAVCEAVPAIGGQGQNAKCTPPVFRLRFESRSHRVPPVLLQERQHWRHSPFGRKATTPSAGSKPGSSDTAGKTPAETRSR